MLPKLPKQYKRTEAEKDKLVLNWFAKHWPRSVAIEVKIKGNSALPHQILALEEVIGGCFSYKIPDMGKKNPFDGIVLKNADAFIVTCDKNTCEAFNVKTGENFTFNIEK